MSSLLLEALSVGILTAIIGFIINIILVDKNYSYNYWYKVLIAYFITGMIIHLLLEYTGGNKWYCKYGNACSK
uniref:Uncharacterized protein n=1 Tax=viral metagenome TaxID=1070528 RepID=A0A6C0CYN1_9ZZZZ